MSLYYFITFFNLVMSFFGCTLIPYSYKNMTLINIWPSSIFIDIIIDPQTNWLYNNKNRSLSAYFVKIILYRFIKGEQLEAFCNRLSVLTYTIGLPYQERVVTKISSCWVYVINRRRIEQLRISFVVVSFWFLLKKPQ